MFILFHYYSIIFFDIGTRVTRPRYDLGHVVRVRVENVVFSDSIIITRIQSAMDVIEASSCVVFKQLTFKPLTSEGSWVHFTNPQEIRECVHGPDFGINGEIVRNFDLWTGIERKINPYPY